MTPAEKLRLVRFEPEKNADQRRWLDRVLGLPHMSIERENLRNLPEHPLVRRIRERRARSTGDVLDPPK